MLDAAPASSAASSGRGLAHTLAAPRQLAGLQCLAAGLLEQDPVDPAAHRAAVKARPEKAVRVKGKAHANGQAGSKAGKDSKRSESKRKGAAQDVQTSGAEDRKAKRKAAPMDRRSAGTKHDAELRKRQCSQTALLGAEQKTAASAEVALADTPRGKRPSRAMGSSEKHKVAAARPEIVRQLRAFLPVGSAERAQVADQPVSVRKLIERNCTIYQILAGGKSLGQCTQHQFGEQAEFIAHALGALAREGFVKGDLQVAKSLFAHATPRHAETQP
jgi:hypothetical protein